CAGIFALIAGGMPWMASSWVAATPSCRESARVRRSSARNPIRTITSPSLPPQRRCSCSPRCSCCSDSTPAFTSSSPSLRFAIAEGPTLLWRRLHVSNLRTLWRLEREQRLLGRPVQLHVGEGDLEPRALLPE